MRCETAAIQALVTHPKYRQTPEIINRAIEIARNQFDGDLECTYIFNLPLKSAYEIIDPEIERIIKIQRKTGMWRIKDTQRKSYGLLKALDYSGHLDMLLEEERFRYDPFLSFVDTKDYYGFIVRRNIMRKPLPDDVSLKEQLALDIFSWQEKDGSWNETVIGTTSQIEKLVEMGIGINEPRVKKAVDWLLDMCMSDVIREAKVLGGASVAHHMFSSSDRDSEYKSAKEERTEWKPVAGCYRHLPMIQTGAAVKTLINLGFENDERVIAACDNFFELRNEYGGWCDTNIRIGLQKRKKS